MATRPPKSTKGKRRRKKKRRVDERKKRIRGVLIGGAIVMATFVAAGLLAFYELKTEEAERLKAEQLAAQAVAHRPGALPAESMMGGPGKGHKKDAKPGSLPELEVSGLKALKLGLNMGRVRQLIGPPDETLSDHRFRYNSLGLEVAYREGPGGPVVDEISRTAPVAEGEAPPGLDLPGIAVGEDPKAIAQAMPRAKVVYERETGRYTAYDPARRVTVEFTPQGITAVHYGSRSNARYKGALKARGASPVSFSQAFDAKSMLDGRLSGNDVKTSIRAAGRPGAPAHEVTLRLPSDAFDPDQLRTLIKQKVNNQIAGGDAAVAVHVLGPGGKRIVSCDWYTGNYAERTGTNPTRFGEIDTLDNISYRWY